MPLTTYVFNTTKSKWVNKKCFVISVSLLRLSPLMHCGDSFWLAGRHAVTSLPVSFTNTVSTGFVSIPVTLIQLLFSVGVSEIIDKLVDSIWCLRQLWVHCFFFPPQNHQGVLVGIAHRESHSTSIRVYIWTHDLRAGDSNFQSRAWWHIHSAIAPLSSLLFSLM